MTKFQEFLSQFNNSSVEVVDPSNRNQCFDLVVAWLDWLGIPRQPAGNSILPFQFAYQIYTLFGPQQGQYFDRIYNSISAIPKEGDIIVWGSYYNGRAGHTAICKSGSQLTFEAFSQNDPLGSVSIVRTYKYPPVLGWLKPKNYNVPLTWEQKGRKTIEIVNGGGSDTDKVQAVRKVFGV